MPNTAAMLEQINLSSQELDRPEPNNAINNVYKLPNIGRAVRYIHAKAGFPTRAIWLKSIRKGNYILWPLINVKNVNKHFPESEETQKGHMRNQQQEVRPTKIRLARQSSDYKRCNLKTDESSAQIPNGNKNQVPKKSPPEDPIEPV